MGLIMAQWECTNREGKRNINLRSEDGLLFFRDGPEKLGFRVKDLPSNSLSCLALESCSVCYASTEMVNPWQPYQNEARKTEASSASASTAASITASITASLLLLLLLRYCF